MSLENLYTEMTAYQDNLHNYTVNKCLFERNTETCTLEMVYY